ncbi:MAG TPA: hypothetical protein VFR31_16465 [Thermoanaerobaculia bacterium]|nr:hypothetical protein [Thermoanaerobaculia bacterium]
MSTDHGLARTDTDSHGQEGVRERPGLSVVVRVLVPLLVLFTHALVFGGWIVDDAGITFVYARNLVDGHGLVSQPGLPPVEGFSNFLWMLAFVPTLAVGLFHPVIVPKLLSFALLAGSFILLDRSLLSLTGKRAVSLVTLLLLAVCTPFVVWTVSGLENPLYVFLLCLLLWLIVREREGGAFPLAAGAVAAGLALTRPDGILFAPLYPLFAIAGQGRWGRIIRYGAVFALILGGFVLFRWSYFGDIYPNTYYAKGGPNAKVYLDLVTLAPKMTAKAFELFESVAGQWHVLLLAALLAGTAFLIGRGRFGWQHGILLAFAWFGAVPYLLLPFDWMEEYRFATPLFPFFYGYAVTIVASLGEILLPDPARRRLPALAAGAVAIMLSLGLFASRSVIFAAAPTVSFQEVVEKFGLRYNRYADLLEAKEASILLPDVGGTLWVSRLRVYDLVGLTDPTIARTLDKRPEAFYDYIFDEVKPTFIHLHHYWTLQAGLDYDPRFRRDYVPLFVYFEPAVRQRAGGVPLTSGDFIRREAIEGKPAAVEAIKSDLLVFYRQRARAENWPQEVIDQTPLAGEKL